MVQAAVVVQEQLVVTAIRLLVVLVVLGYLPRYLAQQCFMPVVAAEH
jgi:type III secretory pathway component EscS